MGGKDLILLHENMFFERLTTLLVGFSKIGQKLRVKGIRRSRPLGARIRIIKFIAGRIDEIK